MAKHDPWATLRLRNFQLFSAGGLLATIGQQMQSVAIGWEIYERTHSALNLGWVGFVQALPVILLALPAGNLADKFDRRRIFFITQSIYALCSITLLILSYQHSSISLYYLLLLVIGIVRAFSAPARSAILPQLVPNELFSNAATWNSSFFQIGAVAGPALGGLVIAFFHSATPVYLIDSICQILRIVSIGLLVYQPIQQAKASLTFQSLLEGIKFVWETKIILATITLDLFAVLLGGATTLLPVFAKDILQVGPSGLGWLRAAPSIGAIIMAFFLAYLPPMKKAGIRLLWAVAIFGLATIVFGLSHSFWLSLSMLFIAGAVDSISVVIRHTLVQLLTPDKMRGRVSAINSIFIVSSNELGGFESGVTAAAFGPVISVVGGGIGTILVVLAAISIWPEVRALSSLEDAAHNK